MYNSIMLKLCSIYLYCVCFYFSILFSSKHMILFQYRYINLNSIYIYIPSSYIRNYSSVALTVGPVRPKIWECAPQSSLASWG